MSTNENTPDDLQARLAAHPVAKHIDLMLQEARAEGERAATERIVSAGDRLAEAIQHPSMIVSHQVVNPAIIKSPCLPDCAGCALEAEWRAAVDEWVQATGVESEGSA